MINLELGEPLAIDTFVCAKWQNTFLILIKAPKTEKGI